MKFVSGITPPCSGWVGGKFRMARQIVGMIPPHRKYVEPFCGAGWVLFRKERSKVEVVNDINGDLINFYRVMRERPEDLARLFEWSLISREEFARLKAMDPKTLDSLWRAYRFYYLFCLCFGGKMGEGFTHFCVRNDGGGGHYDFREMPGKFAAAADRLQRVIIEHGDFGDVMMMHNDASAFYFVDPPYLDTGHYYGKACFNNSDLNRLAAILAALRGKWLLTINDCEYTRRLFGKWRIIERENTWFINRDRPKKVVELIITNYEPEIMEAE